GDAELSGEAKAALQQLLAKTAADPVWQADSLMKRIEETTQAGSALEAGQNAGEVLAGILAKLEEQALQPLAQEDPGNWAKQALTRVREWIGAGAEGDQEINDWRKTRLTRSLGVAAQKIVEELDRELSAQVFALMERPGARLAAAESAYAKLQKHFIKAGEAQKERTLQHAARSAQAWRELDAALAECVGADGGFRLFGGRSRSRQLRAFLDQLGVFA